MRRYWLDPEDGSGINAEQVVIAGDSFHHILDVCRQTVGSQFEVLIGDGLAYLVEVQAVSKKQATAKIKSTRTVPSILDPKIVLCLSVSRFPVLDAVMEKAVELGVSELKLFFSKNSFVGGLDKISDSKIERWQKIIKSATQQSGRGELMEFNKPQPLQQVLMEFNQSSQNKGLFLYEGNGQLRLKEWLKNMSNFRVPEDFNKIFVFVGSEGGFDSSEVKQFQALRLDPVSLGDQVLRVETACVAAVSVLKCEWGV